MSRVTKFRAWDKKNSRMVALSLLGLHGLEDNPPVYGVWGDEKNDWETAHYSDVELMQFTGLLDKNGKEIFEGDVVRGYGANAPVRYERFGFFPFVMLVDRYKFFSADECDVIGNIYENPELL